jgi:acyl-CoA synthetase (AMP-forming)/AMP-acid ligase II
MTIGDIFAAQVRTRPEAVALIDARGAGQRRLTYAEFGHEVAAATAWLQAQGVRRGQAALVFVPVSADLYVALLALFRLGAVALLLDPGAGPEHLEQCCTQWPPDVLLAVPRAHLLRLRSAALRRIRLKVSVGGWVPGARQWPTGRRSEGWDTAPELRPEDPALVTFTSGTTGQPKAAVRSHGFLLAQHRTLAPHLALEPGEVDLATLPVFTLANLASGVTTVLPDFDLRRPGAVDGAAIAAAVERFAVTRITASPAFFERFTAHVAATGRPLLKLRKLFTGGAPVFPRVLAALQAAAPHARVEAVYGSTEAEPIAHVVAAEVASDASDPRQSGRGLLAGRPVPEIRLRILRDRWGEPRAVMDAAQLAAEVVPIGEAGEIVVAGEHVLRGYLGGVGDEETKFSVDGEIWHRTGDAGLLDECGRLWLLGRCAARIDDARGRLYPLAAESVAMAFPELKRVAFVAHAGQRHLVVEADGAGDRLRAQLASALAWAQVDAITFVDTLPVDRRHNAKVDYAALSQLLSERYGPNA